MPNTDTKTDPTGDTEQALNLPWRPEDFAVTQVTASTGPTSAAADIQPTADARPAAIHPAATTAVDPATQPRPIIQLRDLRRTYGQGESVVHALDGVSLSVMPGDFLAIMGASGSGKSTMMNILGMLDEPTEGSYLLDGDDVSHLRGRELALIRNRKIGFVFQSFNLIPTMTALANVELPMAYAGVSRRERRERAELALDLVGLASRAKHRPGELSGGQQQRVAVARSLVNTPALILADEPTGNLDSMATEDVLDVFNQVNQSGRTVILITHEDEVGARASRVVRMRDGRIIGDSAGLAAPYAPKPVSRADTTRHPSPSSPAQTGPAGATGPTTSHRDGTATETEGTHA